MCLQDIQIARVTTPYVRTVNISSAYLSVLKANSRRYALILPQPDTIPFAIAWMFRGTGLVVPQGGTFITGSFMNTAEISVFPSVHINLVKHGMLVTMELFAAGVGGQSGTVDIIEVLFNEEIPPLSIPR